MPDPNYHLCANDPCNRPSCPRFQNNARQESQQSQCLRNLQNTSHGPSPRCPYAPDHAIDENFHRTNESQQGSYLSYNPSGPSNMPCYVNQNQANTTVDMIHPYFDRNDDRQNYPRTSTPMICPVSQKQQERDFFYDAPPPSINRTLPACCRTSQNQDSSFFPNPLDNRANDASGPSNMNSGCYNYSQAYNPNRNDSRPYSYMNGGPFRTQNDYSFRNDVSNQNRNHPAPYSFIPPQNASPGSQPYHQNVNYFPGPHIPLPSPIGIPGPQVILCPVTNRNVEKPDQTNIHHSSEFNFSTELQSNVAQLPTIQCPMRVCSQSNPFEVVDEPFEVDELFEVDIKYCDTCSNENKTPSKKNSKTSQKSNAKTPKSKIPKKKSTGSTQSQSGKPPSKKNSKTKDDKKEEVKTYEQAKVDSINMLSVVISTVLLLAADIPNIPENYTNWSVKYLKCIKNKQGQFPANVKKILKMLVSDEEMKSILQPMKSNNSKPCQCPSKSVT